MRFPWHEAETRDVGGRVYRKVCLSLDVTERRGYRVDIDLEHSIAIFRVDGVVRAVSNICPHKHAALIAEGLVVDGTVQCPLHGWTYSIVTGEPLIGSSRLPLYDVHEENGEVWLAEPEEHVPAWMKAL